MMALTRTSRQVHLRRCLSFLSHLPDLNRSHVSLRLNERYPRAYATTTSLKPEKEYDVVVVGSGAGGLTTAVTAALKGRQSVLVVEKSSLYGGTSALSGGAVWIPLGHQAAARGHADSREQVERYLRHFLADDYDDELISAYLESGPPMLKWLGENTALTFRSYGSNDYYMGVEGASPAGRTLLTSSFDGRRLGSRLLQQVRPPLPGYRAFASLQIDPAKMAAWKSPFVSWKNATYVTSSLSRYVRDKVVYGRGTSFHNGNALVGSLLFSARNAGVDLWNDSAGETPIMDAKGRIIGLEITRNTTQSWSVQKKMSRKHLPNQDWTVTPQSTQGGGINIGLAGGGSLPSPLANNRLWTPISEVRKSDGRSEMYPHFAMGLAKPGSIVVDGDGRRFANEAMPYQDFGKATHAAGVRKMYLIGDSAHLRKYGMGLVLPSPYPNNPRMKRDYLISAPTVAALAMKIGIDPEKLGATVSRFNDSAREGIDPDFARGEGAFDQSNGDSECKPNPSLAPLAEGPFYALTMYPGNGGTLYGLKTDKNARVLNKAGRAVPGLYAVGADANNLMMGHYPSGGLTLGPAMVFGYRAGLHLAGQDTQPGLASAN